MKQTMNANKGPRQPLLGPAVLALLLGVSIGNAQGPPPRGNPEEQANKRWEELRTRLELSEEQQQQVQPILAESAEKAREMRDGFRQQERSRSTMTAMRDEMEKLHKQTRKQLKPILSAEQLEEFDELTAEWREERRQQMRGRGGPPPR